MYFRITDNSDGPTEVSEIERPFYKNDSFSQTFAVTSKAIAPQNLKSVFAQLFDF